MVRIADRPDLAQATTREAVTPGPGRKVSDCSVQITARWTRVDG